MNIYKIVTFDGFNSKQFIVSGYDLVYAIQCNGAILQNQIIKAELVGSQNKQDLS